MITMKGYTIVRTGHRQELTVSAIAVKLGKDRKTVRKYLRMDKDQFIRYLERMAERGKAYSAYKDEILKIYKDHEGRTVYASSSIHDYLSEKYGELPGSDRTLRNYLAYLKTSGAIGTGQGREYRPVEPLDYVFSRYLKNEPLPTTFLSNDIQYNDLLGRGEVEVESDKPYFYPDSTPEVWIKYYRKKN
jgi:hypothetical protein